MSINYEPKRYEYTKLKFRRIANERNNTEHRITKSSSETNACEGCEWLVLIYLEQQQVLEPSVFFSFLVFPNQKKYKRASKPLSWNNCILLEYLLTNEIQGDKNHR